VADESPASVASWKKAALVASSAAVFFFLSNSRACDGSTALGEEERQFPMG
jgi:hypothetical protein